MSIIVQKFGGSSVANAQRIRNVADIVTNTYKEGNDVVVVVSAQGDTTDDLIAKAREINDHPSKREMDVLLNTGEQMSMSLLAMAVGKLGFPVISLTGWQIGLRTDTSYSDARIRNITADRIIKELDKKRIVIVAGFQGINKYGDMTTLGRGGSDTTAVAVAATIRADLCQIYTDVDGVYTADPRVCPSALKLCEITYDEMLELASLGAQVLHNRAVEMAKKYAVGLEVLSSFSKNQGTEIKEILNVEQMSVNGVTRDNDISRIAIIALGDKPGTAFKVFSLMAKHNINVDTILQSIGRNNTKDIGFTVHENDVDTAVSVLKENKDSLGFSEVTVSDNVSKVSIVGAGMVNNPGVAAKMFEALYSVGININMISTSEIKISVLIDKDKSEKAVRAIHNAFF